MDPSKISDLDDLEALLSLMGRHGLTELEIEGEGRRIRLKRGEPQALVPVAVTSAGLAVPGGGAPAAAHVPAAPAGGAAPPSNLHEVESPMVGTFYRAPSPEADPFVREGDRVEENTTLCLIEAMKVMNEIPAGVAGVVKEILLKNGEPVEFGQPLFRIAVG